MAKNLEIKGADIPVSRLTALHERRTTHRGFAKIVSSIRAIGLIEPLCVYPGGEKFIILDGFLRYLACIELGIQTVPCIVFQNKESYTFNRMVNQLSPIQESRMILKSREVLDDKTIAKTFGMKSFSGRLQGALISRLHADVVKALDAGKLMLTCAQALSKVKPERQIEILSEMKRTNDFTPSFARAQVTRTPVKLRCKIAASKKTNPWSNENSKESLCKKLTEVQNRYDFYSALYRQYVSDFIKLSIYIRKWIVTDEIASYLKSRHPEAFEMLKSIVFDANEMKPRKKEAS